MPPRFNRRRGGHKARHNSGQSAHHNSHHDNHGGPAANSSHPVNPFKPRNSPHSPHNPFQSHIGTGSAHNTIYSDDGSSSGGGSRSSSYRKRNYVEGDRPYENKSPRGDADTTHHRHPRAKHLFNQPPRRTAEDEFPMFDFIKDEPLPGKLAQYANEDTFYQARVTQLLAAVNPEFRTPALESLLRLGDVERISAEVLHFLSAVMQCKNLSDVESHDIVICDCNGHVPLCFMRAYMHEKLVSAQLRTALREELKLSEERRRKSVHFLGDAE